MDCVKFRKSRSVLDAPEVDTDDEYQNEESLEKISVEILNQEIGDVRLDELEERVKNVIQFRISCTWICCNKGDETELFLVEEVFSYSLTVDEGL